MSEALEQAYASAANQVIHTLEFSHSGLAGGVYRLVRGYADFTATLEDSSTATFEKSGFAVSLPQKGVDGRQDILIQLDNVSLEAYQQIRLAKDATRASEEKIICKYRSYLLGDTSGPAGAVYTLTVSKTTVTRKSISLVCSYTPLPDISWPIRRYNTNDFPGLKYV